jgi:transcriptional regulator with XRE-family HTH domain
MPLVNQNIRFLRRKLKLTQERFAEKVGIKRSLVGAYEEDRAIPPIENLRKISEVFEVSVDKLLNHSFEREFRNENLQKPTELPSKIISRRTEPVFDFGVADKQPDLFTLPSPVVEDTKIRYVSKGIFKEYIPNHKSSLFLNDLPELLLPFLPKGYLRAFDAPDDFLVIESILIGERVENYDLIKEGQSHLLIKKNGEFLCRRVYNQINIKNKLLLSSDKEGIASEEIFPNEVLEIWLVKSYFSKSLPKPPLALNGLQQKINELNDEINKLTDFQSKR